jgi:hypothetical protein
MWGAGLARANSEKGHAIGKDSNPDSLITH